MHYRAALVAALAPLAAAQYSVTITSNCAFPVYGWNVVNNYGNGAPTFTLNGNGASWTGPFEAKSDGGGASIKLKNTNNIFDGKPQNQVEYKMAGSTLFYDLSNINGNIFSGQDVVMQTTNSACPTVHCPADQPVCSQAYNQPDDLRTLACPGGANIQVLLCGSGSAPASSPSQPPAAATTLHTSTTPAPALPSKALPAGGFLEESPEGVVEVVVATTVIPVTVTEHLPAAATGAGQKREAHAHAHQHRASRFQGRHRH